jgi:hypothetical protein
MDLPGAWQHMFLCGVLPAGTLSAQSPFQAFSLDPLEIGAAILLLTYFRENHIKLLIIMGIIGRYGQILISHLGICPQLLDIANVYDVRTIYSTRVVVPFLPTNSTG